jgi:hypothetical protein
LAETAGIATAVAEPQTSYLPPPEFSTEPATVPQAAAALEPLKRRRRRPHSLLAKVCLLGIGVPLFLVGLLATIAFSSSRQQGLSAGGWPQADARVIDSGMDVQTRHRNGQKVKRFKPRVSYEYEVGGERYTGDRIKYGVASATISKLEADRVLAKYPKDATVKVHYVAKRPYVSVLEPGLQEESKLIVYIWVTGAFTLVGLLMSVYALIGKRARPERCEPSCGNERHGIVHRNCES